MNSQLEVEVFRAGDYGPKGVWGENELERIAADYDPALHEAPVTLDHARKGPALGWVEALRRVGDRLVARLRGLNGKLVELIREGSFKKRSVEIYPAMRETGRPYLRAVSFLGASVPEVKGLADPLPPLAYEEGRENEPCLVFEEPTDSNRETAQASEPAAPAASAASISFAEAGARLRQAGKWRPAWAERGIEQFYRALAAAEPIEAGEGQLIEAAEWFTGFLESLPPVVAMEESAPAGNFADEGFAPGSCPVDVSSLALHREVVAFQQANPGVSYAEALGRCAGSRRA
jgi:hypothetical protein